MILLLQVEVVNDIDDSPPKKRKMEERVSDLESSVATTGPNEAVALMATKFPPVGGHWECVWEYLAEDPLSESKSRRGCFLSLMLTSVVTAFVFPLLKPSNRSCLLQRLWALSVQPLQVPPP